MRMGTGYQMCLALVRARVLRLQRARGAGVQDPTERSFSSWSMVNDRKQHCNAPGASASLLCGEPTFLDTFTAFRSRAEFTARPECEFRMPVRPGPPQPPAPPLHGARSVRG